MQATTNTAPPRSTRFNPAPSQGGSGSTKTDRAFCLEALAPCLADLKRQIALRQAMP